VETSESQVERCLFIYTSKSLKWVIHFFFFFFFLIYVWCPGQLTRTTTIPHGPLNILQAQEQVRHRGGDRRAHRGSNPGRERNKSHGWPQQLDPQVRHPLSLVSINGGTIFIFLRFDWYAACWRTDMIAQVDEVKYHGA